MLRCCQCGRPFSPSPRVVGRQVTCGDPECKRRHHAESCRQWRHKNRDATSHHYPDAVVAFRVRHPTYQREWRILRSLREIRDSIEPVVSTIEVPLARLIGRAGALLATRDGAAIAPRARGQDWFVDVVAVARRLGALIKELASLGRQLDDAADRSTARDTRCD